MIHFLSGYELSSNKALKRSMHRDRARQFHERLQWEVSVDGNGEEIDEYDSLNPLYIIASDEMGSHEGSMRLLPTTGRTMVNEHFLEVTDGVQIVSPNIWECTRFCISPSAGRLVAPQLLAAGAFLMRQCCIDNLVGVFDSKMEKIYSFLGAPPTIIGRRVRGGEELGVGLWEFDETLYHKILARARLSPEALDAAFKISSEEPAPESSNSSVQIDRIAHRTEMQVNSRMQEQNAAA